jgi:hypothetical protein
MKPQEVLDISIAQLETLAAFLHEQLGEGSDDPRRVTTETRACNEVLGYLKALILRVRTKKLREQGLALWNPPRGWPLPYNGQHSKLSFPPTDLGAQRFLLRSNDGFDLKRTPGESI